MHSLLVREERTKYWPPAGASSPPPPTRGTVSSLGGLLKPGQLNLSDLAKRNYVAIVQHFTQREGVIHQVVLRGDKVSNGLIRLGDTPGDELVGWNYPQNIVVLAVLGEAVPEMPAEAGGRVSQFSPWKCVPILEEAA